MGRQSVITLSRVGLRLLALRMLLFAGCGLAQSPNTPLLLPSSVVYDTAGNLYFTETGNHVVRRLTTAGVLSIVAGTGTQGYAGDGGPAKAALLDSPSAVALDGSGDLLIADTHNHRIRRVDALTGLISTYANASLPVALAFNPHGELAYADAGTHQILLLSATGQTSVLAGNGTQGFSGDGVLATAASLDTPSGLAFDGTGNLFLADSHNHCVRRVDAVSGIITTLAGTGRPGYSGDGVPASTARLDLPRGLVVDAAGDLYIADSRNQRIRRVDGATGLISTTAGDGTQAFLGDGAPATNASLDTPRGIALSPAALPTLADSANNRVRQVDPNQQIQTSAGVGAISAARAGSMTILAQSAANTLAASVNATTGTPAGTVTLVDGASPVASAALTSGTANFTMSLLSTGSHTLTAAYAGSATLLPSTSPPLIVTVGSPAAADFTLTASAPTSVTVAAGNAAGFGFGVALTGAAFSSPITLSVAGAPRGSIASFNPAVLPPPSGPASFTLTIDTPASAKLERRDRGELPGLLVLAALLLPFAGRKRRRTAWLLSLLLLAGCGDRVSPVNASAPQPVTYNITVTGTATSLTGGTLLHTAQVTLVVD